MFYSAILLDLLSLTLQNGQIGWYSGNSVPHSGQYQAMLMIPHGLPAHSSLMDLCTGGAEQTPSNFMINPRHVVAWSTLE